MIYSENPLFVWYIILPLSSSLYFSREITLRIDNIFSFPPLPLGQRGPGLFNTKNINHAPLCPLTFNGCIYHKLIPVVRSCPIIGLFLPADQGNHERLENERPPVSSATTLISSGAGSPDEGADKTALQSGSEMVCSCLLGNDPCPASGV